MGALEQSLLFKLVNTFYGLWSDLCKFMIYFFFRKKDHEKLVGRIFDNELSSSF